MQNRTIKFVSTESGEATALQGQALEDAKKNKSVISKAAFAKRQLVGAESGEA
jgi:hypothetical protein